MLHHAAFYFVELRVTCDHTTRPFCCPGSLDKMLFWLRWLLLAGWVAGAARPRRDHGGAGLEPVPTVAGLAMAIRQFVDRLIALVRA